MPKGSSLEVEVQTILDSWIDKNRKKHVATTNKTFTDLLNKSKGQVGLLPEIAEHPEAVRAFTFFPSSLGPLEIKDSKGVLLGYRFKIEQRLMERLREADAMLPDRAARRQGGGGDPEARGVFDSRHYAAWADYGAIRESKEMEEDQPVADEWLAANQELFDALSHELRMQNPEQYVRLTGTIVKHIGRVNTKRGTPVRPVAGAWHGVCINRNQSGDVSKSHQDWMDVPNSYNCVAPYGDGFTGGDLVLWQLKMRVELSIGEGFMFMGALIAHKVTEITSGLRNSIDLFCHKSTFDNMNRTDQSRGKPQYEKKEGKKRMEEKQKKKNKERKQHRAVLRAEKKERQKGEKMSGGKCNN